MALIPALLPSGLVTQFPAVSTLNIAGFTLPGKWILQSAAKKFGWQIQQGYALSGAFVIPKGDELVTATFKGEIWTSTDFGIYNRLRKQLLIKPTYTGGGSLAVNALGVDHPELVALGVTAVVLLEITPMTDSGGGLWTASLSLLQYRPPQKVPQRPTQIIPAATRTPVDSAVESAQVALQNDQAKLAALQGRSK